ncbi:NUDIX domain-containing protein [Roseivivax isoporae]|uniref:ADP-ribose pyrophosphatase n=1 Tax=Roseivivax isoporae LMG 25204 TaxID=1449351 RepID=X7FFC7_9RHOB|nr:NUDIX domain-containing protein [Roseivivax isoporae]ETX30729.1 tellurium resistance protein [Roseivivax isoporae LMG 25204]
MTALFLFGTLRHLPLLARVLGREETDIATRPAALPDHRVAAVAGEDFPMLAEAPGRRAEGMLVEGLGAGDVARIDHYEDGFGYALAPVTVETEQGPVAARAYMADPAQWSPGEDWSFDAWRDRWGEIATRAADEAMLNLGTGAEGPPRFARLARAWARMMAAAPAPQTLRTRMTAASDVALRRWLPGHDGFFRLRRFELSHRTFAGGWTDPVRREAFVAFDAALVLPYDPVADLVLVIEQLRYGPIARGDPAPWVLEPVAGLVDAGESPEDTARREAVEEAHLALDRLEPIARVYASPGYSSEFFHCFLGLCDLSDRGTIVAGLDEENEDIRSHVLPFDEAMALVDSGEVNAGPLAMMLLWLARARPRLREAS